MPDPRTIEWIVRDKLPGDNDAARTRRIAVLRVVHAAGTAQQDLDLLGAGVSAYLVNPDDEDAQSFAWRVWINAEATAKSLEALAREIRKSHRTLIELSGINPEEHGL